MYIFLFLTLGLIVGSFSNVVIYRLPIMMYKSSSAQRYNLAFPRSYCPECHHKLGVLHIIPLVSWFILNGRCNFCNIKISVIYPAIELLMGLLYLVIAFCIPSFFVALPLALFCSVLIILICIDFRHMLLPDCLTLPLMWIGLLWSCSGSSLVYTHQAIIGAAFGYLTLWGCYWFYFLLRKREGLGYGDLKLNAALGAWLGSEGIHFILLIAPLLGVATWLLSRKRGVKETMPFGPALCSAAIIYLYFLLF